MIRRPSLVVYALLLSVVAALLSGRVVVAATLLQVGTPFELPVGSNFVLAVGVVGFLMSPAISLLNRQGWSSEGKAVGAFVWCFLAASLLFAAGDRFDLAQRNPTIWFGTFLAIFTLAITLHRFFWKPSGIGPAIERATG